MWTAIIPWGSDGLEHTRRKKARSAPAMKQPRRLTWQKSEVHQKRLKPRFADQCFWVLAYGLCYE